MINLMVFPVSDSSPWHLELTTAMATADAAAEVILKFYNAHSAGEYEKKDGSPVTDADLAADKLIRERLSAVFPNDAFLTEESEDNPSRLQNERVWIVDPLDGTAQFIAANGKFDVLIALVMEQQVQLAVSVQPTTALMHVAIKGEGAWRRENGTWMPFHISPSQQTPRVVTSVYYLAEGSEAAVKAVAAQVGAVDPEEMKVGTQSRAFDDSQRFYDVFIGFPQAPGTSAAREWDLAAPDLIINEAGGVYTDLYGRRHLYNKRNTHFAGGLLVCADPEMHARVREAIDPFLETTPPSLDPADDLGEE